MDPRFLALWPKLKASAQVSLLKQAEMLVNRHSGTLELQCHEGGVRRLRVGQEYKPGDMEYTMGADKDELSTDPN
jgi:hypothetical protein